MNKNIGELIKQRRTENKMTLKDISEATELSIGYLSQLERGLTSIAHDTLKKVAKALGVEMTYFMEQPKTKEKAVLRSYEREILRIEGSSIIEYAMTAGKCCQSWSRFCHRRKWRNRCRIHMRERNSSMCWRAF